MIHKINSLNFLTLSFFLLLLSNTSKAETLTITFDTATPAFPSTCNQVWEESGIPMFVKQASNGNCGTFGIGNGAMFLAPATVNFNLSELGKINSIEVDIGDNCGFGCTKAIMYFGYNVVDTVKNTIIGAETLLYTNNNNLPIDAMCVSGGEGGIFEVRIDYEPRPANEEKVVINFDEADPAFPANCNDVWTEDDISMQITNVPEFSSCIFFVSPNSFTLAQGRVTLDLSNLGIISEIAVDVIDNCSFDCTTAAIFSNNNLLVDKAGNQTFANETLLLTNPQQLPLDYMYFESFEGAVLEVRICYTSLRPSCAPDTMLEVDSGDVYIKSSCNGVILTAPNGNCFRLLVNNDGSTSTESIVCP